MSKKYWLYVIGVLLIGLFLRAHNITTLPVYSDESLHIRRGAVLYDFQRHPAVESNGKFLFYFLLGIFDLKQMDTALWLSRMIVAVSSLITATLTFRIGRSLYNELTGLVALTMYCFMPFAVFFERTALADPFAGLVGTALVWQSLRFARQPSNRNAVLVGVLVALTLAAKLTLAFLAFMPIVAVLLYAEYNDLPDMLRRFFPYGLRALLVVAGLWSLVLVPAVIENLRGGTDYVIYPVQLVEPTTRSATFFTKITDLWEKMALLAWTPVTVLLIVLTPIATLRKFKPIAFTFSWLVLVAVPAFVIVDTHSFQSRYLMSGVPALAVLFGLVTVTLSKSDILGSRFTLSPRMAYLPLVIFLVVWIMAFAVPFARTDADDPTDLDLPYLDRQNYFEGYYNAYGIREAFEYLRENGHRHDGKVTVLLATRFCLLDYYQFSEDITYFCDKRFDPNRVDLTALNPYRPYFGGTLPLYLIIDYTPEPQVSNIGLERVMTFPKPFGDIKIEVWQFYAAE